MILQGRSDLKHIPMTASAIEFGWFLPTAGDTTAFGVPDAMIDTSPEFLQRVATAAENAGFSYMLIPVDRACWEAYITGAFITAQTQRIAPLIAARPGYINPVLLAKMIGTFDQMSNGRICVNLIAGQASEELVAEGITYDKEARYALMEEEVTILKTLWTASEPVHFKGRFHHLQGASVTPQPQTMPRFYLGGGSESAWDLSAKHADVHLFWGDLPEQIASNIADLKARAARHDRASELAFGMRLQIICRETESAARQAAAALIEHIPEAMRARLQARVANSEANRRVQELAATKGEWIMPHLWSGLTRFRPGAGICVVGDPDQCARTLQQFIDVGCTSFCLSGYLHDAEAERFARMVRPLLNTNVT